jgi:hypothetical protein
MTLPGQYLGTSLQLCFLHYWLLSPSVQPHDLTWSISRHISATVFLKLLIVLSECTTSWTTWSISKAHLCNCVSYITDCCLQVYILMTLPGQSLGTSLQLCFLHYWVLSPSVQPHGFTWSNSRHISATVFLILHYCVHYWVLSPSVQLHDLTWSISRHTSATCFLIILSAVSQCTASWPYLVNL